MDQLDLQEAQVSQEMSVKRENLDLQVLRAALVLQEVWGPKESKEKRETVVTQANRELLVLEEQEEMTVQRDTLGLKVLLVNLE